MVAAPDEEGEELGQVRGIDLLAPLQRRHRTLQIAQHRADRRVLIVENGTGCCHHRLASLCFLALRHPHSARRPASLILVGSHGGNQTRRTCACRTPGTAAMAACAPSVIASCSGQPGVVMVMAIATSPPCTATSYTSPRSTTLTPNSGS